MPRWLWVATGTASKMRSISSVVKPSASRRVAGAVGEEALRAGAGGHALRLDAGEGAGAALGCDGDAVELVDLLGVEPGGGRLHGLGVAGGDAHLGAAAVLALADLLGDVRGELLGAERLGEDDGVDRLVHDLLEAGHVDAGLVGVEVDEGFELGEEEAGRIAAGGEATWMTFSTPRTPTRVRLTRVSGAPAWTSRSVGERGRRVSLMGL